MRSEPARVLTIDGRPFAVRIVRHPRARRVTLRVEPWEDAVRLTLPPREALAPAMRWAVAQGAALARAAAERAPARPFRDGGVVPLEGRDRPIRSTPDTRGVAFGDEIQVGGVAETLSARLTRALKARARAMLDDETRHLARVHGLTVASVGVGDPSSRWGSCSADGRIRYSWRLILMPPPVRRAIVAHEVAHRIRLDHSPLFHAAHERLLGTSPVPATAWLTRHGRALHGIGRGVADAGGSLAG